MAVPPPAVDTRFADLCQVRSSFATAEIVSAFGWEIRCLIVASLLQELGVDKGVASEAATLLEEGKGALLTPSSFGSKSVRSAVFCAEVLDSCAIAC